MNMPGMGAGPTGSPLTDALALALRLLLLLSAATLAGAGLAAPFAWPHRRRLVAVAWSMAAVSAAAVPISLLVPHTSTTAVLLHLVLVLALPPLLRWPRAAAADGGVLILLLLAETRLDHTGLAFAADALAVLGTVAGLTAAALQLTGSPVRRTPLVLGSAAALVASGIVTAAISGLGFGSRLYGTGYGLLVVALIVLPIVAAVLGLRVRTGGFRAAGAGVLAVAFLVWCALPGVPQPGPEATPGVPLLAHAGDGTPLLVSPLRQGKNLVHFPAGAGDHISVTAENGRKVQAGPMPGAEGSWADVDLPAGRSSLTVEHGGSTSTVQVDTGAVPPLPSAVGDDGPECASAALGGLLAGSRVPLTRCPSDALDPADADALRQLVGYMAAHGISDITVAEDGSPRSRQAAQLVRTSAARAHLRTGSPAGPRSALVDVAGWSRSATLLGGVAGQQVTRPTYGAGVFLAPWLLYTPVVNRVATSFVPLRFNPRDQRALTYSVTVENAFGKENPSTAGLDQWRAARREAPYQPLSLYACAQVSVMMMPGMDMTTDYPGQWVADGTCVPVSGALSS